MKIIRLTFFRCTRTYALLPVFFFCRTTFREEGGMVKPVRTVGSLLFGEVIRHDLIALRGCHAQADLMCLV